MVWKPNVTVAAVIEHDGKFLLVVKCIDDYLAGKRYPLELLPDFR